MKITEYKNNIHWDVPQFVCDNTLNDRVKAPIPGNLQDNKACCMLIVGSPGSGKTSLAIGLLTNKDMWKKCFHSVYVVMPKNSRDSIAGNVFKNHNPTHLFDDLNVDVLNEIKANCEIESPLKHYTCLLMDDVASSLKDKKLPTVN